MLDCTLARLLQEYAALCSCHECSLREASKLRIIMLADSSLANSRKYSQRMLHVFSCHRDNAISCGGNLVPLKGQCLFIFALYRSTLAYGSRPSSCQESLLCNSLCPCLCASAFRVSDIAVTSSTRSPSTGLAQHAKPTCAVSALAWLFHMSLVAIAPPAMRLQMYLYSGRESPLHRCKSRFNDPGKSCSV